MSSEWPLAKLGDLTVNLDTKRKPVKEADRKPGPYPYYGASGIVDYVDGYIFDGEHLLIAEDGENLRTRQTPIAFRACGKFWVNNHAHILQGNNGVSTEQLMLFLKRTNIQPYITGAVQAKLSQSNMWKINFLNPSRQISEAFGGVVKPLFDSLRQNADIANTLTNLRDALLPRLISGQLRLSEAEAEIEALTT